MLNRTSSEWPNMPSAENRPTSTNYRMCSLKSIYNCCFQDRTSLGLGNAHFELLSLQLFGRKIEASFLNISVAQRQVQGDGNDILGAL